MPDITLRELESGLRAKYAKLKKMQMVNNKVTIQKRKRARGENFPSAREKALAILQRERKREAIESDKRPPTPEAIYPTEIITETIQEKLRASKPAKPACETAMLGSDYIDDKQNTDEKKGSDTPAMEATTSNQSDDNQDDSRTNQEGSNRRRIGRKRTASSSYPTVQYKNNLFGYQVIKNIAVNAQPDEKFPIGSVKDVEVRRRIHETNYHLRQNQTGEMEVRVHTSRTLKPTDGRRKYRRRKLDFKSVNHWSQRKTLVQDIEFLSNYSSEGDIVVYAGAAPGTHMPFLAELFPWLRFHLYDWNEFKIDSTESISITPHPLSMETARSYATNDNILFVCDEKSTDFKTQSESELELGALGDMKRQWDLYRTIQPKKAFLRFQLPWGKGTTRYLGGELFVPIWGAQTTSEVKLVPDGSETDWDHVKYEEQMFYFNTHTRVQYYRHGIEGVRGLDHCYDCACEVDILSRYLHKYYDVWATQYEIFEGSGEPPPPLENEPPEELINTKVPLFMQQLSKVCSSRELFFNPPPSHIRAQWFSKRLQGKNSNY